MKIKNKLGLGAILALCGVIGLVLGLVFGLMHLNYPWSFITGFVTGLMGGIGFVLAISGLIENRKLKT